MPNTHQSAEKNGQNLSQLEKLDIVNSSGAVKINSTQLEAQASMAIQVELAQGNLLDAENQENFLQIENSSHEDAIKGRKQDQLKKIRQQSNQITKSMRQASDLDTLLETVVKEIRQETNSDRALIYRFDSPTSGTVLAESKTTGWTPSLGETLPAISFGLEHSQEYLECDFVAIKNNLQINPYQLQILERFQIKASLCLPIMVGIKVWGLLVINNCAQEKDWQEDEICLLSKVALVMQIELQQFELATQREQQRQSEKAIVKVINKISQTGDIQQVFKSATQEVRYFLKCDRVSVYRFHPDWSGEYVAESVANGWTQLVGNDIKTVWQDTYLQETQGGSYRSHENIVVDDIYKMDYSSCYTEILEQFEIKAYLTVPIFWEQKLWGILAAYQNQGSRHWREEEVSFLTQIGMHIGIALSQAENLDKLQRQSQQAAKVVELDRTVTKVIDRIRQSLEIDKSFGITTREVRSLVNTDRVAVFRFNPDWSGEFVAESVGSNWVRLVGPGINSYWADSYLQETQGGRYSHHESLVVNDMYQMGHSACHVEALEQYQAKAYIIVPIFQADKLWGLLAAYDNTGPRIWEESEVSLLTRIGEQLGIALQQAEYLQQLEAKSAQLAAAAQQEKAAYQLLEQQAMRLIAAVTPALEGDLTVRAPMTDDLLGTIANSYNNTLQALSKIVIQLQKTAKQVAQTSNTSDSGLKNLKTLAQQQSKELSHALQQLQQMVMSTQDVVANVELVEVAIQQANQTVESGDAAMNRTVEAIQVIRETVAQTSKKIKRLSESSQKISKVVNLIGSFATQTNVLALNAAIEATRAGEYGKGFAVVADEVRSLSRQSAAATIEIEKLVQEIQAETGEVSLAMDIGIQQVVDGTNFVNETRQNLNAIVSATFQISSILQQITEFTQTQMLQSVSVTASMKDVAKIASRSSAESNEIFDACKDLSGLAQELLVSTSQFKVS